MRRIVLCALIAAAAFCQDRDLSITWVGQSSFILKTDGGVTVVTDPPGASVGYTIPAVTADAVTVSHNHTDHNFTAGVGGQPITVDGRPVTTRQQVTAAGIAFTLIPGFHDDTNGSARGQNTITVWTQSGLKIAHFGDLGQEQLTAAQLADLQNLDILFLPAGGFFTVSPQRAAQYVTELKPRIAILMHYRTAIGGPAQLAGLPAAAAPFPGVAYKPSTAVINRATLPAATETWVMEPRSDAAVVNGASFLAGQPVAPGSIASVFGKFTASETGAAQAYPLPRKIGQTEVFVDGKAVPLYYASAGQINFQIPSGTAVGQSPVEIRVNGQTVVRTSVSVILNAPGVFVAANLDGTVNSTSNPARRGDAVTLYGTGQGSVSPAVDDGVAAGTSLSNSAVQPTVTIAGKTMPIQFSGLAPGFAGLWQINVPLAADAPAGNGLDLLLSIGGVTVKVPVSIR
jgi:uncharacterized protein (TIGR03437 family)